MQDWHAGHPFNGEKIGWPACLKGQGPGGLKCRIVVALGNEKFPQWPAQPCLIVDWNVAEPFPIPLKHAALRKVALAHPPKGRAQGGKDHAGPVWLKRAIGECHLSFVTGAIGSRKRLPQQKAFGFMGAQAGPAEQHRRTDNFDHRLLRRPQRGSDTIRRHRHIA